MMSALKNVKKWIEKGKSNLSRFDFFCLRRKVYLVVAVFIWASISILLSGSFDIEKNYSNYAGKTQGNIHISKSASIEFAFSAKENRLSSLQIYKDMSNSRLSVSDKAAFIITDLKGEEIFQTDVYLYHTHRTYITVDCQNLRLQKGETYVAFLRVTEMSPDSICYLQAYEFNDFAALDKPDSEALQAVGLRRVPDITYKYLTKQIPYIFIHQIFILSLIVFLFIPKLCKKRWFLELTRAIFIPILVYLLQEVLNMARTDPMQFIFPFTLQHYFILAGGILIILCFYFLIYAISGNGTLAVIIVSALAIIVGYVNHFKILMRGDPAVPWDLFSAGLAAKITTNYSIPYTDRFFSSILFILLLLIVIRMTNTPKCRGIKKRMPALFLSAILLIAFIGGVALNKSLLKRMDITYGLYPPLQSFRENGTMFALVLHLNHFIIEDKKDETDEPPEDLIGKYTAIQNEMNKKKYNGPAKPNVIAIMSEAFSDLREVRNIETNEPVLPFYDQLKKDSINGKMAVSIFGGGTCNTEFEFLTGYSVRNLLAGASVYELYIQEEMTSALPFLFHENGYKTVAIHPFDGAWWSRSDKYPFLGFDQFITQDDFTDPVLIRDYISDQSAFDRVIEEYEKKDTGTPLFTFLVTMQNHADYTNTWEEKKYDIKINNFPNHEFTSTENYLSLMRESDAALEDLITYFEDEDEPTMIVFFGDHKPYLDSSFYSTLLETNLADLSVRECIDLYTVPYLIWANYPVELEETPITSPNFLGQTVLDAAGIPLPDERACLRTLQSRISAISAVAVFDLNGNYYTSEDYLPEDLREYINDYAAIQYSCLFDENTEM